MRVSNASTVRFLQISRRVSTLLLEIPVSYGEQFALRGQVELDKVASATSAEVRAGHETHYLELLRSGDLAAFEKLVNDHSGDIYGLLYRLTEDVEEARDLTQETFLRAFQSISRFRGDADLKTWLYRIALNQARNRWRWWRRRRRDSTISIDAELGIGSETLASTLRAAESSNPEIESMARERDAALQSALRLLGSSYREAVILRDIKGLSYEEIAQALEITVGTVKSRLSRGREELRKRLGSSFRW
jgi:RNA polymerase sigma-70 factor (ECF subfamily)